MAVVPGLKSGVASNEPKAIREFKIYHGKCFQMKDLGTLNYILGVEVSKILEVIFLSQWKYSSDIILEVGLLGAKAVGMLLERNHCPVLAGGWVLDDPAHYRRLIDRLIYLCFTRSKLSYNVHILSQFTQQPKEEH
ncbi:hypothetical protein A4A49_51844 [Nicotiana attenuata]|uniref:Uncharacterized protein n=1 Tax=Nicotiana attenuata TaxID=49451 RepID=A0A1J6KA98_NICAT|nr:hypothetical protein A4A49_51844 [Nicotiana attenuata]